MNTFGTFLRLTTFGESHGPAVGGVLDGLPAGLHVDFNLVDKELSKRSPGSSPLASARREADDVEWLSGISPEGVTLGTPIAFITRNRDCRPSDYAATSAAFRPNHADFTYEKKYGVRDHRGGGRASARETFARVAAAAVARQWLAAKGVMVQAVLSGVGTTVCHNIFDSLIHHPESSRRLHVDSSLSEEMMRQIEEARKEGDSVGGEVACLVTGVPAGVGDPVYAKLHARLAEAMMGINAAKAFEYGLGAAAARARGGDTADIFDSSLHTLTNFSGGIQGGIANGMPIFFKVYFKPTPTIMRPLPSVDRNGNPATIPAAGRHDPCVALRAVPVVEAMAALVMADMMLSPLSP